MIRLAAVTGQLSEGSREQGVAQNGGVTLLELRQQLPEALR